MRFVDDVDLEVGAGGRVADPLPQAAYLVDAAVAGGVQLYEIHGPPFGVGEAGFALVAGLPLLQVMAVGGLRQETAGACLAGAARPAEEIGVRYLVGGYGVAQGARYRLLARKLAEGLGTVFTIEDFYCHCLTELYHSRPAETPPASA